MSVNISKLTWTINQKWLGKSASEMGQEERQKREQKKRDQSS